jgi:hypothetical protein
MSKNGKLKRRLKKLFLVSGPAVIASTEAGTATQGQQACIMKSGDEEILSGLPIQAAGEKD